MTANGRRARILIFTLAVGVAGEAVQAQTPSRDLSDYSNPSTTFTVVITLNLPPGTTTAGVVDTPPTDWAVTNISDSGTWDEEILAVKWGPFFDPGIPATVSYDITPTGIGAVRCFTGQVSYPGVDEPIGGDDCVGDLAPAASAWGLAAMTLSLLAAATLVLRREQRHSVRPCLSPR